MKFSRLGKTPADINSTGLHYENYVIPGQLPEPPGQIPWQTSYPIDWGVYQNDKLNNCTICAAAHLIANWTARTSVSGKPLILLPDDVIAVYSQLAGYNPSTGAGANNDVAATDMLSFWQSTGIAGNIIEAFVSLEYRNDKQIKESIFLFGGCYMGLALPTSAKEMEIWTVPTTGPVGNGAPASWGNHVVTVIGYDERFLFIVTLGALKFMTWSFYKTYCDEAYAVLSKDWISAQSGLSPGGFDFNALTNDINQISRL